MITGVMESKRIQNISFVPIILRLLLTPGCPFEYAILSKRLASTVIL